MCFCASRLRLLPSPWRGGGGRPLAAVPPAVYRTASRRASLREGGGICDPCFRGADDGRKHCCAMRRNPAKLSRTSRLQALALHRLTLCSVKRRHFVSLLLEEKVGAARPRSDEVEVSVVTSLHQYRLSGSSFRASARLRGGNANIFACVAKIFFKLPKFSAPKNPAILGYRRISCKLPWLAPKFLQASLAGAEVPSAQL